MIGRQGAWLGAIGALVLVPLLGAGGPDPTLDVVARRLVAERAAAAAASLEALEAAIAPALDEARRGAAAVVAGDVPPGPRLVAAATLLRPAEAAAHAAREAVAALSSARRARDPGAAAVALDVPAGEVESIAAQLAATADAGDAFAEMRARAEGLPAELDAALAALEAGRTDEAAGHVAAAREAHAAVAGWEVDFVTLPVWIETTGAMVEAVDRFVAATARGDAAAAAAAADEVAALEPEADEADRALRIALGEGGAAVTAAPLGRLADVLRETASARTAVASILQAVGR